MDFVKNIYLSYSFRIVGLLIAYNVLKFQENKYNIVIIRNLTTYYPNKSRILS